jgi:hypothetical protein
MLKTYSLGRNFLFDRGVLLLKMFKYCIWPLYDWDPRTRPQTVRKDRKKMQYKSTPKARRILATMKHEGTRRDSFLAQYTVASTSLQLALI